MNTVTVYGDEAGTMPLRRTDGYFVTATFATEADLSSSVVPSSDSRWPMKCLLESKGEPAVCYIKPNAEYEELVGSKLRKMDLMARARKLTTRDSSYVSPKMGIVPRNYLWIASMLPAIINSIDSILKAHEVSNVRIVFDQKTFHPETERLLRDQLKSLPTAVASFNNGFRDRIQFSTDTISVEWNTDTKPPIGLRIADYLASHALLELKETGSIVLLERAGFADRITDITPILKRPIDDENIRGWEQDTGLREPKF